MRTVLVGIAIIGVLLFPLYRYLRTPPQFELRVKNGATSAIRDVKVGVSEHLYSFGNIGPQATKGVWVDSSKDFSLLDITYVDATGQHQTVPLRDFWGAGFSGKLQFTVRDGHLSG